MIISYFKAVKFNNCSYEMEKGVRWHFIKNLILLLDIKIFNTIKYSHWSRFGKIMGKVNFKFTLLDYYFLVLNCHNYSRRAILIKFNFLAHDFPSRRGVWHTPSIYGDDVGFRSSTQPTRSDRTTRSAIALQNPLNPQKTDRTSPTNDRTPTQKPIALPKPHSPKKLIALQPQKPIALPTSNRSHFNIKPIALSSLKTDRTSKTHPHKTDRPNPKTDRTSKPPTPKTHRTNPKTDRPKPPKTDRTHPPKPIAPQKLIALNPTHRRSPFNPTDKNDRTKT
jgi:hypothetical protein